MRNKGQEFLQSVVLASGRRYYFCIFFLLPKKSFNYGFVSVCVCFSFKKILKLFSSTFTRRTISTLSRKIQCRILWGGRGGGGRVEREEEQKKMLWDNNIFGCLLDFLFWCHARRIERAGTQKETSFATGDII